MLVCCKPNEETKLDMLNKEVNQSKWKLWLKRVGIAGFLFFLIKGLVWIGVFIWLGKCAVG
jgi:hypothetical protein